MKIIKVMEVTSNNVTSELLNLEHKIAPGIK